MMKRFAHAFTASCGIFFLSASALVLAQEVNGDDRFIGSPDASADLYEQYSAFKTRVAKDTGFSWSMDVSYLPQWGRTDGGSPAGQWMASPSINWTLFDNADIGSGSIQLSYTAIRYATKQSAGDVQRKLGMLTPINDGAEWQNEFAQLTYTHALPGNAVIISAGQYSFGNFDGNQYLANQQHNFNNAILAQNGSATYANAGLGAYVQLNATSTVHFAAGFQSANNFAAPTLSAKNFADDRFAWFAYAQWTPAFEGLGKSQYSLSYYDVPSVPEQAQPSHGWSINAVQNLNDTWALFGRANRAYDFVTPIRASFALGVAINNPLGRSPTDQIGLAFGYSDVAQPRNNPLDLRNEKVLEAYWNWTVAKGLLLTPDVQYIRDPALDLSKNQVWVLGLRSTLIF